jgi:myo-inositol-1(or 4)-monophosphatase
MTTDLQHALETAMRAARAGGQLARERLGQPGYEKRKGPRDVLPGAALDVQSLIVYALRQEYPEHSFLLEESDEPADENAEHLWIIDPIDGSTNFLHGIPIYAISIAYRENGHYQVGVVYDPSRDEMFHAVAGQGAFLNGRPISVDAFSDGHEAWEQAVLGTDWRGNSDQVRLALRLTRFVAMETFHMVVLGSPALGRCYVAAGRLHGYFALDHLKLWDIAAAAVILKEAGGILTDAEGASWLHPRHGYLASNNVIHGWMNRTAITVLGLAQQDPPMRQGASSAVS